MMDDKIKDTGKDSTEFYNQFASRQVKVGINKRHEAIFKGLFENGVPSDSNILEVGCGIGTVTQLIAPNVANGTITAIDLSPININIAKERLKKYRNIRFIIGDVINTDIDGSFDIIVLPDVLEHIPLIHHQTLFEKLGDCLNDDGFIYINIPHPFMQAWTLKHRPELLQIIDQEIITADLLANIKTSNLYMFSLQTKAVWMKEGDYQQIILRKRPVLSQNYFTPIHYKQSVFRRIIDSFKQRLKRPFSKH